MPIAYSWERFRLIKQNHLTIFMYLKECIHHVSLYSNAAQQRCSTLFVLFIKQLIVQYTNHGNNHARASLQPNLQSSYIESLFIRSPEKLDRRVTFPKEHFPLSLHTHTHTR